MEQLTLHLLLSFTTPEEESHQENTWISQKHPKHLQEKKKEKNMKIATDSLFLEHGHYLHQHTGLKSVTEQSCCAVTQDLSVGTRTERENLSKIAFTERSNRTAKKPGGLQMGTTILCLACKISSGNMKGKGRRGVWVCKDTHRAFLREPEGSEPSLLCPDWDWKQHPGHPGGAACWDLRRVQSRKETLEEDEP